MSCLRSYVKVKQKQEEAKSNGNVGLIFLLMVLGGLFLASHAMYAQVGHMHGSLKNFFKSLLKRETLQNAKQSFVENTKGLTRKATSALSKDAPQQAIEGVGKALNLNEEKERD